MKFPCVLHYLCVVHALDASLCLLIGAECDESKTAAGIEEVCHLSELLHLQTNLVRKL